MGPGTGSLAFATLFVALVAVAVIGGQLPSLVLGTYVAGSVCAFVVYWRDKRAAKNNRWRTPESTLHLLSLLGGWPGALVAQRVLRHKSSKRPFRIVFWGTVMLNCAALVWLLANPDFIAVLPAGASG